MADARGLDELKDRTRPKKRRRADFVSCNLHLFQRALDFVRRNCSMPRSGNARSTSPRRPKAAIMERVKHTHQYESLTGIAMRLIACFVLRSGHRPARPRYRLTSPGYDFASPIIRAFLTSVASHTMRLPRSRPSS